jgi:serine/threonine protein kinase
MFDQERGHGFEVDYWAIGVILYYMLYGKYPFDCLSGDVDTIYHLIQEEEPEFDYEMVSEDANDLIR